MATLSLIYGRRPVRNRVGKLVRKVTIVISHGPVVMVGLNVFREDMGAEQAHLFPRHAKIVRALLLKGGLLSRKELLEYLYPESGTEPDSYETGVQTSMVLIRKELAKINVRVITRPTMGWELKIL